MECKFTVGQKVVCIAVGTWQVMRELGFNVPVPGQTYTIRAIYADPTTHEIGVRLVEVTNPRTVHLPDGSILEAGWQHTDFKPLDERKTDIGLLERFLVDTHAKIKERV